MKEQSTDETVFEKDESVVLARFVLLGVLLLLIGVAVLVYYFKPDFLVM